MNPNYFRPCTDLDVTRPNRSGLSPPPGGPFRCVAKSDGVELAELTEDDLLFSFGEKKWGKSISCVILEYIRLI